MTIYVEYPDNVAYTERVYDDRRMSGPGYLGVVFDSKVRDAAVVHRIARGSPAEEAGLARGDMILALNGEEIMAYQDAIAMIRSMQAGDQLDIAFVRGRSQEETQAVLDSPPVRTARYEERGVIVEPQPRYQIDVDDDRDDGRLFDRDRDDDGNREGLLDRILD
jgi:predicted metalloprotease with PDZ domain